MENLTSELSNVTGSLAGTESYPIAVTAGQLAGAVMSTLLAQLVTAATTTKTAQQQPSTGTTTPTARDRYGTPYNVTDEPEQFLGPGPDGSGQSNLWFVTSLALSSRSQQQQQQHQQNQQNQQQQQQQNQHLQHSGAGGESGVGNVSPVTLSTEWPRLARLLLLAGLSVVGSIGNVFMISSVMIEDHLKKAGNAFIVNIALADLLITSVVMPASTIVLLAGIDNSDTEVCNFHWFLAACSFLVSILTLAMMAIENYLRLCTFQNERGWFNKTKTTAILLLIWTVACIASGMQFMYDIRFDYCNWKVQQVIPQEAGVVGLAVLLPLLLTFITHVRLIVDVKRTMALPAFKPSLAYTWDLSLARTNFYSFLIFVVFWLPFCVIFAYGTARFVSNRVFYTTVWIGLSKSCFHNVIYCLTNRHFRSAYISLFNYCCCKTTVAVSRRQRADGNRPTADVRVHIIPGYNMYSYTSPQRSGNCHGHWGKRDCHEL
ncbi:melatonin receptor type 1B-like [Anopheles ziemanni]|uniref:melatonin receptor type 1B-like n=1 Tax=Anopheles coustani TaxID=139045 RepID=UPI00265A8A45|nr:melatonin receptor type 1B-like [Anopheles coustani]XP_058167379.1 melatonin receptor type 1B-like [Anopheles ziemanni]